jgi:hypothetical protein
VFGDSAELTRDAAFLATLLGVDGRHTWVSAVNPTVVARRLWARFEVLPFRYGMALAAGVVALIGLVVGGSLTMGGGSSSGHTAVGRPPRHPVEAVVPPAPTWGAYVPPRRTRSTSVPAQPYVASVPPRPKPTHATPRPTSTATCPPTLKKWSWVWEMCKRRNG